jgi:uncharacterized protein (DUF1015 family)
MPDELTPECGTEQVKFATLRQVQPLHLIQPFRGLRPIPKRAADVAAPPYDVLSIEEARARAAGRPWSFLHISRAEIDLPQGTDAYAPQVYARAAANLHTMLSQGILERDSQPAYYIYRLTLGSHTQIGLVCTASIAAYDANRIRKHELTRPDKEDDRVRQIEALNAQTGPVLLAYPHAPATDALLGTLTAGTPIADVTMEGGVRHTVWQVDSQETTAMLTAQFDAMPALYIADGHHRSAAASRVAAARRTHASQSGSASDYFLAVCFPHHQMRILPYNRVVRDLNGLSPDAFLQRLRFAFDVKPATGPIAPNRRGDFGLYLPRAWYRLEIRPDLVPAHDPVGSLDVSLLTDQILTPILGIHDLRTDERIDFVGGSRGTDALEQRVDAGGMAAAFSLHPTQMADLMAVAECGQIMPPKSTWFEPKLADGLISHVLD